MPHAGEPPCLLDPAPRALGAAPAMELERDLALQLGIPGDVHVAEAAGTEALAQLERPPFSMNGCADGARATRRGFAERVVRRIRQRRHLADRLERSDGIR